MLYWCKKCLNRKNISKEQINLSCLSCKWQYVGTEWFDRKADLFENDKDNDCDITPYKYFGRAVATIGVEII